MVYDRGNLTHCAPNGEAVLYKRAYPEGIKIRSRDARRGCLFLDDQNKLADGRRSSVFRTPLIATLGPRDQKRKHVRVVAKVADDRCRSHHLLRQEAKAYAAFPREFYVRSKPTAPPIVPKFYGYYVPINSKGESLERDHPGCNEYATSQCHVHRWPKAILLMEDCGEQIDTACMPFSERNACWDLVERMHRQGFSHGYAHPQNMLVQPGPMNVPVEKRSYLNPSFRLVSFGRWRALGYKLPMESARCAKRAFEKGRETDVMVSLDELRILNHGEPEEEDERSVDADDEDEEPENEVDIDADVDANAGEDGYDSDATVTC
ncbi:uncharacterized protein BXZ73DRAFT_50319 [Epithele typhae]|uniref:uncharacterized protein n=1 Tax=Epithele typhae TaxID=378194 RepID=UPI0020083D06|nr:uncharacterized protein BXZ73DRAFT_50319 [Epithele typhae]KAH9924994.1 hypothetical protein BXZ73DRAFT_50319 [Epithele typhae]